MKVDQTNLCQDDTGIERRIVISNKYPGQETPCLRYYVQDIEMLISIEDIPHALTPESLYGRVPTKYQDIVCWILLNRPVLWGYWQNPEYTTNKLLSSLKKLNELNKAEIEEFKPFDSTSFLMRRIGLPSYVVWVYTYKTESSPIVKITEPSTESFIIVSLEEEPVITEGKGLESFNDEIDFIVNWIRQNQLDLMAYWSQEIDSVELSERLL